MTLRQGKSLVCKVVMLDDQVPEFHVSKKAVGGELFSQVASHLQLFESDYFGLEFKESKEDNYVWLDREKPILLQTGSKGLLFKFKVKFYSPDPNLLEDEFTRYLFALQIKQDLATGRLVCNANTTAMLSAYIAQGEIGDYSEDEMPDHTYLKSITFVPNQTDELEQCIMQYHRDFGGMSPSDADFNLLDTARKTDYYGIVLSSARDHEGVSLQLAVTDAGVYVYQNNQRINTFSWAKVRKISFKRKRFLIKLIPSPDQAYYKNIVEFFFESRNKAKNFWKLAIEHHAFFRCPVVKLVRKSRRTMLTRGSSFRYTGRTQKQLLDHVKDNYVKGSRSFERTLSTRHTLSFGNRSFVTSRSTTLNSKREFQDGSVSSGSHTIAGSHTIESPRSGSKMATSLDQQSRDRSVSPHNRSKPSSPPPPPPAFGVATNQQMDRKYSEPVLGHGHNITIDDHKLARAPDYCNIPEKVEEPVEALSRSDSVKNIPKVIDEESHAEPRQLQHPTVNVLNDKTTTINVTETLPAVPSDVSSPAIARIHSETDTSAMVKHPRDVSLNQSDHVANNDEVNTNHTQFAMGSSEILNGTRSTMTDTLTDSRNVKKPPTDKVYYIVKELLMTERTYHKDLTIVINNFRTFMAVDSAASLTLSNLYQLLQPIYDNHCKLLEELEHRIGQYDSRQADDSAGVILSNQICKHFDKLECYRTYLGALEQMLTELIKCCDTNEEFGSRLHDFEMEKMCYLPVFALILKPAHRLVYYEIALSKLVAHCSVTEHDYSKSKSGLAKVTEVLGSLRSIIAELENTEKLIELQEDTSGVHDLVHQGRYFIREGCLQKLSRRGYQQRLFLLLSDVLLYTTRTLNGSQPQFKVHGYMPLSGMSLEESDANMASSNGFTIYGANRCLIVAAHTQEEKDKWLEDLNFAISIANSDQIELADMPLPQVSLPSNGLQDVDDGDVPTSPDKAPQPQHRANTTMHVCWHRNTSVSIKDIQNAIKHQLSGYLLRKFKNSNGWQKLWVVFTNFCLFFYKTYQDDYPLASLPLLGYSVSNPSASDAITRDFVFKLQFKNHVYFFRAESEYAYDRWMEVINSATHSARRTRMFSRLDSTT